MNEIFIDPSFSPAGQTLAGFMKVLEEIRIPNSEWTLTGGLLPRVSSCRFLWTLPDLPSAGFSRPHGNPASPKTPSTQHFGSMRGLYVT